MADSADRASFNPSAMADHSFSSPANSDTASSSSIRNVGSLQTASSYCGRNPSSSSPSADQAAFVRWASKHRRSGRSAMVAHRQ
ncbi:hypothetical protein ACLOJK_023133 [Asimina triloba]